MTILVAAAARSEAKSFQNGTLELRDAEGDCGAHGYVGLLGWITLTITAQVYKLFPMFVWEERFRELWGKAPVSAMRDLYSRPLQTVSNGFLSLGIAGAAAGIVTNYLPLITFFHGLVII